MCGMWNWILCEPEWGPAEVDPWGNSTSRNEGDKMDVDEEKGGATSTTGISGDGPHIPPDAFPFPDSPRRRRRYPPRLGPL